MPTKAQIEYIEKHYKELTPKQLAKDTGLTLKVAQEEYQKMSKKDVSVDVVVEEKDKVKPRKNTAFMQSVGRNDRGSLIMTEGASSMADEHRKTRKGKKKLNSCIHKPLGE